MSQMRRESACQDAHEAAIFGAASSGQAPGPGARSIGGRGRNGGEATRLQREEAEDEEDDPLDGAVVVLDPWGGTDDGGLASDAPVVVPAPEATPGAKSTPDAAPLVATEVSGLVFCVSRITLCCVASAAVAACWRLPARVGILLGRA